ncbi:hypothetical protein DER46DRAFT_632357 [Fusarium sp. MPI-SDFR-AT-0072]|uniref:T6SS Phospholipase effector Tle1-like catalytic domain-containing protein n=1 Tax=Fusarium oxysporum f. sp. rapae TaxID=485398 RepID=A0A8J5P6D6_FUSOX|nr:Uncharacterized protein Forpe1208_v005400 [Fusarium oxysporum f. sp. rapae]KAH7177158.1 hypothetical protein DER46DRAFT_632357 [Fusarium sp. MPI-SDFR-AT-0072]
MSGPSIKSEASAEPKPLILLGDGSWCGREADTKSNIYLLARMVGIDMNNITDTDVHVMDDKAWYIHGVGLGSTFLDYIFNGITAQDIAVQCIAAYKFIVDHYSYPDRQIWMFGLSRGAFMVRSVAGMINNCGIVKPRKNSDGTVNDVETDLLCHLVYKIYRSDDPINHPRSPQSVQFRRRFSWPLIGDEEDEAPRLRPAVKFLGLIDTVGSLGIPDFVGGVGLDWPQFHDQKVSSVVELVYHAVSLHDDLYVFPPCLAKRNPHHGKSKDFGITECWFPGVHYDLGRQRFRFLRMFGGGRLEHLLARWNWASKVIQPNEVVSDLVLKWLLEAIKTTDPSGQVISTAKVEEEINAAHRRMVSENRQLGDGDVYHNIVAYAPFGTVIVRLLTALYGTRWQTNQIYQLFFALRDRLVADRDSRVYNYMEIDGSITNHQGQTIHELAGLTRLRYPSRTYEAWRLQ